MKIDPSNIPGVHVLNVKPVTVKDPDGTERKVWRGVVRARGPVPKHPDAPADTAAPARKD